MRAQSHHPLGRRRRSPTLADADGWAHPCTTRAAARLSRYWRRDRRQLLRATTGPRTAPRFAGCTPGSWARRSTSVRRGRRHSDERRRRIACALALLTRAFARARAPGGANARAVFVGWLGTPAREPGPAELTTAAPPSRQLLDPRLAPAAPELPAAPGTREALDAGEARAVSAVRRHRCPLRRAAWRQARLSVRVRLPPRGSHGAPRDRRGSGRWTASGWSPARRSEEAVDPCARPRRVR